MKKQTAELFKLHLDNKKFEIESVANSLHFYHDFTDAEVLELVQSEYGTSITQPVPDLFQVIIKSFLKQGIEYAKNDVFVSDKLSDL